jgi:large repetitive protein
MPQRDLRQRRGSLLLFDDLATTRTITGLTAGQSYTFKIAARSVVRIGHQSTASNAVTPT